MFYVLLTASVICALGFNRLRIPIVAICFLSLSSCTGIKDTYSFSTGTNKDERCNYTARSGHWVASTSIYQIRTKGKASRDGKPFSTKTYTRIRGVPVGTFYMIYDQSDVTFEEGMRSRKWPVPFMGRTSGLFDFSFRNVAQLDPEPLIYILANRAEQYNLDANTLFRIVLSVEQSRNIEGNRDKKADVIFTHSDGRFFRVPMDVALVDDEDKGSFMRRTLDYRSRFDSQETRDLLGFVFDPDDASNGQLRFIATIEGRLVGSGTFETEGLESLFEGVTEHLEWQNSRSASFCFGRGLKSLMPGL